MKVVCRGAVLGAAALAVFLASGTVARSAQGPNKCLSGKNKCASKKMQGLLKCHSKAEKEGVALDTTCTGKANDKYDGGTDPAKGCFAKLEVANDGPCLTTGDSASIEAMVDAFVDDVVTDLDPGYPTPVTNLCSAGKKKCVLNEAKGILKCHEKAVKDGVALDSSCVQKKQYKYNGGLDPTKGCFAKLEAENDGPCLTVGDSPALENKVNDFIWDVLDALDYQTLSSPFCGDGQKTAGEPCDPTDPVPANQVCPNSGNGLEVCTGCTCQCPGHFDFITDADHPASLFDSGWTGLVHDQRLISGAKITVAVTGCENPSKPCGTCTFTGPVPNINFLTNDIDNRRCTPNTAIACTNNADCFQRCSGGSNDGSACAANSACPGGGTCAPSGTCEFYAGSYLPLSGGGTGSCVANQVSGSITGTNNNDTGQSASVANLIAHIYSSASFAQPCPRCVGDPTLNDGVAGGTCAGGARDTLSCDANGKSPVAPFGSTSLDCPPTFSTQTAQLPVAFSVSTGTESRTLSAASPNCSAVGYTTMKCLCDTCNNAAATVCSSDADCIAVGATICGGKRCVGGPNFGAPCSASSECPSGSCTRPGTPTAPNQCNDGVCTPTGGNEGECAAGPQEQYCEPNATFKQCAANADCTPYDRCAGGTNHGFFPCTVASQCPGGTCEIQVCGALKNRECYLDNGVISGSITATGAPDPSVFELSHPTVAGVACIGPTTSASINSVSGLPGPLRRTEHGLGRGLL